MIEIIPAILPKSFEDLTMLLGRLRGVAPFVQIDLVGTNVLAGQEAIPFWQEFDFEADIMLPDPLLEVQTCINAGASRVVVHASAQSAREALKKLQPLREGNLPIQVGVALASHDEPEALKNFDGLYDYVQVMGIDHIGKQGEPFNEHAIPLIERLRHRYPELKIQVDGGVTLKNARRLAEAGANRLVVGSAIFTADNAEEAYNALYTEANVGK